MNFHAMEQPDEAQAGGSVNRALRDNISALAEREREQQRQAPVSDRMALLITRFAGSMTFVVLHVILFGAWIIINLGWLPPFPQFDASFVVLAMTASVEAIFLSTFVLIGQNRMAMLADRRADLDLHISLLTEHELTRIAELIDRMAQRLGVPVDQAEFSEIERDVAPTDVLHVLDEHRRQERME